MKNHSREREPGSGESGVALIAVLALLITVSLLVMAMAAMSQLANLGTRGDAERLRSGYIAEGAMNRVIWLIAADISVNGTIDPGDFDYSVDDRYLPDGVDRWLDYYGTPVKYRILPGAGGLSLSGGNISNALTQLTSVRATNDEAVYDARTQFLTRYQDYVDSDDLIGVDGMETGDYDDLNQAPLPRNGAMQYREELWWLPDGAKFFPPDRDGRLTLVNPLTLNLNSRRQAKPSLYLANYALLTNYAGLSSDDARETLRVLKAFRSNRELLSDSFDPLLWASLTQYFSTADTGYYRVTIENAKPDSAGGSFRLDAIFSNPGIAAEDGKTIDFYEWMCY